MPNRTAKSVSAIFAGILASIPLTTISRGETVTADNCLAAPKGDSPPGSHWYYRIEHSTKRHCWYLRGNADRLSQAAPQIASPSARPPLPQPDATIEHSVANARAELPAQTNRSDGSNADLSPAAAAWSETPRTNASDANAASTVVASRWPEPSRASLPASPQPATINLASNNPPNPIASPAPGGAAATSATAEGSSQEARGVMPLLVALTGALTLAGLLFAKFGRARRPQPRKFRARRRPVWEQTDDDRIVLSDDLPTHDRSRRSAFSQPVRTANSRSNRRDDLSSRRAGQV